jgi:hypothetical protein
MIEVDDFTPYFPDSNVKIVFLNFYYIQNTMNRWRNQIIEIKILCNEYINIKFENNIKKIEFGFQYNKNIDCIYLPKYLEELNFGFTFNSKIYNLENLTDLKKLKFGKEFNQNLDNIIFPDSIEKLDLGWNFSNEIGKNKLPENLKWLILGPKYIFEFSLGVLPDKLSILELSCYGDNSNEYRIRNKKFLDKSNIPLGCMVIN